MRSVVLDRYGCADVLEVKDMPEPTMGDDDVLVAVRAVSLNPLDWHFMTGLPYLARIQLGLLGPSVKGMGADLAGCVEAVGKNVTRFEPGDEVFGGYSGETPAHPAATLGTCAEQVCVPEDALALKPANLSFEQAATVSVAGQTALQGLRDLGRIESGQQVLINGASGGVGSFAVQLAKSFGARVTGVCSGRNVELVHSLGADNVVDYTREDFTLGGLQYDLVFDTVGNRSLSEVRRVLQRDAVYVSCFGQPENLWLGPMAKLLGMALMQPFVSQRLVTWVTKLSASDHEFLRKLLEEEVIVPVIDEVFPLADIQQAMRKLATGHARGKVVIAI